MTTKHDFVVEIAPDDTQKSWAVRITFSPFASQVDAQKMAEELASFYGSGGKSKVARIQ